MVFSLFYKKFLIKNSFMIFPLMVISCAGNIHYQPPVNDPLLIPTDMGDRISLLTYNIQAIFSKDQEKLNALMDYINREAYDFVVFQELFDEQTREYLVENIDTATYQCIVSRIDYDSFPELLFQDSGLFLMSRFPQVDLSEIMSDQEVTVTDGAVHMILTKELSVTTDFLANKSVLGSLHQINAHSYVFLFTTHVQAIGSRRQKRRQYTQIKNFIDYAVTTVIKSGMIRSSDDLCVLLAGDFNSDAYDKKDRQRLSEELGFPRDLHKEQNPDTEEYTMIFRYLNFYKRFDYIWSYDQIGPYPLKKIQIQTINATDLRDEQNNSISDHMALKASLDLGKQILNPQVEKNLTERRSK